MLLLDSEALSALAHGPTARRDKVRALLLAMRKRGLPVASVTAILAEVVRGRPADAAVFATLTRERLLLQDVDRPTAVRAGQLLGAAGMSSECAVDAFLVATADLRGGAVIATVDRYDIGALGERARGVRVADVR